MMGESFVLNIFSPSNIIQYYDTSKIFQILQIDTFNFLFKWKIKTFSHIIYII